MAASAAEVHLAPWNDFFRKFFQRWGRRIKVLKSRRDDPPSHRLRSHFNDAVSEEIRLTKVRLYFSVKNLSFL
jgi:hypothetical protein